MQLRSADRAGQARRAEAFRAMHHGREALLLPNPWDALSARIFEAAGFAALATTSGGIAWSLGCVDGERLPRAHMLAAVARIVNAVSVPVTADIEAGYGASAEELRGTVRAVVGTGAVGINLEDGLDGHTVLREAADAASRIAAARAACDALGVPMVINARIDVFLRGGGTAESRMAEAVERARAYVASGADCVYPIGLSSPPEIAAFVAAVKAPVNVWAKPGMPGVAALRRLGVARISTATAPALVAAGGLQRLAAELRAHGDFDCLASPLSHAELQRLMKKEPLENGT